jgi:hypothetical protein
MAITFPLDRAGFMNQLPIAEMSMTLAEAVDVNQTRGGEVLRADMADRLWQGRIRLGKMKDEEAGRVTALIERLLAADGTFMCYDAKRPFPLLDPTGTIVGPSTPTLHTIGTDRRECRIQALPANYPISAYDRFGLNYGSGPVRMGLFRAVVTTGLNIILARPVCKAVIVPGSYDPGSRRRTITDGVEFAFQQAMR